MMSILVTATEETWDQGPGSKGTGTFISIEVGMVNL